MGQLDDKVAVVTGGAQGIGRAIAEGLALEGARIVIADLRGAEEAAAAFRGGVGLTVDVADEAAVQRMTDETVERYGSIDVLINNAGLYASLEMRVIEHTEGIVGFFGASSMECLPTEVAMTENMRKFKQIPV